MFILTKLPNDSSRASYPYSHPDNESFHSHFPQVACLNALNTGECAYKMIHYVNLDEGLIIKSVDGADGKKNHMVFESKCRTKGVIYEIEQLDRQTEDQYLTGKELKGWEIRN